MNMRRNVGGEIGGTTAGVNKVSPQARAAGMEIHVDPTGLKNGEVRIALVQMAQAITLQAESMTA